MDRITTADGAPAGESCYIKAARHAVGLDHKRPYVRHGKRFYRAYRNHYVTVPDDDVWTAMVSAGYAEHGKAHTRADGKRCYTFWLTRDGLDWLGGALGIHIYDESR